MTSYNIYVPSTTVPAPEVTPTPELSSTTTTWYPFSPMYQMPSTLRVQKKHKNAILPEKAYVGDLGYDLFSTEDVTVMGGATTTLVSTGIAIGFPAGYGGLIRDRSGMATKTGLFVVAGVIDNGYTGEIKVAFRNLGPDYQITAGQKIAQLVLIPTVNYDVQLVECLDETDRNASGFGSTG